MENIEKILNLFEAEVKEKNLDKLDLKRLENIVKSNQSRLDKKADRKESNEEFGTKTKAIKSCKIRVFSALSDFLNFCSGVGLNGDKSVERQVKTSKFDYTDSNGKTRAAYKGSTWPTKAEFEKVKSNLMKEAEQLQKYEDVLAFNKNQQIGYKIRNLVDRIDYNQLDFDTPEEDKNGKKRLNADIYDDLFPILGTLRKSAVPLNFVKNTAALHGDDKDYGLQRVRNIIGRNIVKDQLSDRTENAKGRYQRMKDAIYDEKKYEETRRKEQGIDNITTTSKIRNELAAKAKQATSEEEKQSLLKQSRKEYDASRYAAKNLINTKTAADFLTDNGIDKLTNKKATAIIDKWIKENAPKDDAHKIKVYGSINGRSEQGLLAFIPGETSTYGEKAIKLDGAFGFRLVKTFFTKLTDEQKEYVEDNRKNSAWKAKVNKVLVKAGICTEGFIDEFDKIFSREFMYGNLLSEEESESSIDIKSSLFAHKYIEALSKIKNQKKVGRKIWYQLVKDETEGLAPRDAQRVVYSARDKIEKKGYTCY